MLEVTFYSVHCTKIRVRIVDNRIHLYYFLVDIYLNYILLFIGYVNVCS